MKMTKHDEDEPCWVIICFTQGGRKDIVKVGLTLAEAQAHCKRSDTRGHHWFHGYGHETDWPNAVQQFELQQEGTR